MTRTTTTRYVLLSVEETVTELDPAPSSAIPTVAAEGEAAAATVFPSSRSRSGMFPGLVKASFDAHQARKRSA